MFKMETIDEIKTDEFIKQICDKRTFACYNSLIKLSVKS